VRVEIFQTGIGQLKNALPAGREPVQE